MSIYTINKHYRVVETVQVIADTEQEAIELARNTHSNERDFVELIDSCITDVKNTEKPLDDLISDAEEYLEKRGDDGVEFRDKEMFYADYEPLYNDDSKVTVEIVGAYFDNCEIHVNIEQGYDSDTVPISCFSEADQYRICETILKHKRK